MNIINMVLHKRVAQNTIWLIAAKIYQVVVNLVVSLLTARYLGPANFGLINYAASLTAMFTSLCTLGINSILVNELLRQEHSQGEILGSAIGMRLLSSLTSVITIVALAVVLNPGEKITIFVVAIYSTTLLFQCIDTLNYWYQAKLWAKTVAVIAAVGYTTACVYKIILLATGKDIRWFAASHVVEYALVAVLLLVSYRHDAGKEQCLRFSFRMGTGLLSNSYHYILSGMMVAVYSQMDKIMLKSMLGEAAVGYYSAAYAISSMWPFVLAAVIDSAKPVILLQYDINRERFEKYMICLYGAILYISFAAAMGISLFSGIIIRILYGEAYMAARSTLCIICWSTAFSYLGVARSTWLVPQGKQKYEKYIALTGALCNLLLNRIMIPLWGVNGAAFATLMTQICANFLVGFFIEGIRPNNILILRSFCFWKYLR